MISDLPHSCGIVAACASKYLDRAGIDHNVLRVSYSKYHHHLYTVFMDGGILRAYDSDGSVTLPKNLTLDSKPLTIAKAIGKLRKEKFIKQGWYDQ